MFVDDDRLAGLLGPWAEGRGPRWHRLGCRLVALVDEGALSDGARLPTERSLAKRLGISRATTTAAYGHAKEQGRLISRQGSGSFVCRPPGAPPGPRGTSPFFTTLGVALPTVIDLTLAETPTGPNTASVLASLAPDTLARAVVEDTGYHPQGLLRLRTAIAAHLATMGQPADPDAIVATTGAQQAIALTAQVLCPPGATVLVEAATFPGALEVFRRLGLRVVSVPTDAEGVVPEALDELAARLLPALAYLIPVANNPTGVVMSERRLDQVAAVLARRRLPVLDDRAPQHFLPPGRRLGLLADRLPAGQAVTVGSISKVAWSGLRAGWLVTDRRLGREIVAARIAAEISGSAIGQWVAAEVMPHVAELAARTRAGVAAALESTCAALVDQLGEWAWTAPVAGPWLWVQLPGADAVRLTAHAANVGIRVAPGPVFSAEARLADRIRLALVKEPAVMIEAVHRLRAAWDSLGGDARVLDARPPALVV